MGVHELYNIPPTLFAEIERAVKRNLAGTTGAINKNEWAFTHDLCDPRAKPGPECEQLVGFLESQLYSHFKAEGVSQPVGRARFALTAVFFAHRTSQSDGIDNFQFAISALSPGERERRKAWARSAAEAVAGIDRAACLCRVAEQHEIALMQAGAVPVDSDVVSEFFGASDLLERVLITEIFGVREALIEAMADDLDQSTQIVLNAGILKTAPWLDA